MLLAVALGRNGGGRTVIWWGDWPPHGRVVGIDFAVDGLGGGLALFVAVLAVPALLMAAYAIRASAQLFFGACLIFVAAMVGYCLTGDLFNLFVFFELMSVSAYVLVGYEVRKRAPLEGALTFAVTNSVGSILFLFGIGLLYGKVGALEHGAARRRPARGRAERARVRRLRAGRDRPAREGGRDPVPLLDRGRVRRGADAGADPARRRLLRLGLYGFARVYWTVFDPALGATTTRSARSSCCSGWRPACSAPAWRSPSITSDGCSRSW